MRLSCFLCYPQALSQGLLAHQPDAEERWQEALTSLLLSTLAILADDGTLTLHMAELAPSIVSAALVADPQSKFQVPRLQKKQGRDDLSLCSLH